MALDGRAVAAPSSQSLATNQDYFLYKPEVAPTIYKAYSEGLLVLDILRYGFDGGRETLVGQPTFTAHEENYPLRTITVGSVTINGGGSNASIVLDTDDLDSQNRYFPRENFKVLFGDINTGSYECIITNINAVGSTVTLTVYPVKTGVTLNSSTIIVAGQNYPITSSSFATGTDGTTSTMVGYNQRTFYTQIMKEALTFDSYALSQSTWHPELQGGMWYNHNFARAEFLLDVQMEMAMLVGQPNTNSLTQTSTIDGASNPLTMNKSIWQWGDELGYDLSWTSSGGFPMTKFDEVAAYYESVGVMDSNILFTMGGNLYRSLENESISYVKGTSGGLNYLFTPQASGMNKNLEVGFDHIKKAGMTFILHKNNVFSNPYMVGAVGGLDAGMMFPLGTVKVKNAEGNSITVPNLSVRYKGVNGYSRKRIVGRLGGMDGFMQQAYGLPILNSTDGNNTHWLTEVSFPYFQAFKTVLVKKTS